MIDAYSICNNQEHLFGLVKEPPVNKEEWEKELDKELQKQSVITWASQKKKEWENKKPFNKEQFMKDAREVRKTFESEINFASASECPVHQCKNCGVVWAKKK